MWLIYKKESWILLVIVIVGVILRLYKLDTYSIFFDEKSTMVVSQGMVLDGSNQKDVFLAPTFTPSQFWSPKTLADYYEAMSRSDIGNSPFYYLLLHFWLDIFGISDFSARSFSVLFSTLTIGLIFLFGRRFFSPATGLIAAALVAVEPFFISYSHQARNYSLTFFLALMATYFFLRIIENDSDKRKSALLYAGYIFSAGLGLLSHFLTMSVLLGHAVYALLFLRSTGGWMKMGMAGVLVLSGLFWWLFFAGGQSTLDNLNGQAILYRSMAESNGRAFGDILPATFKSVLIKSIPTLADEVIFTNGLSEALEGKKNILLAIAIGFALVVCYRSGSKLNIPLWMVQFTPFLMILIGFLYYNNHKLQFTILSVSIFALSFLYDVHVEAGSLQRRRLCLLYIMIAVPILFIIMMSFKNGHTYALTQHRYSGSSFPYVIVLISLLLQYHFSLPVAFKGIILFFMTIQLYFVGQRLNEFYQDRSIKYGYFATPRPGNPYYLAARRIIAVYQVGDTIVYPAKPNIILREEDRNFSNFRMRDAQITNLYLPKNVTYIQKVDTTEPDRILIRRKKDVLEIVNLKGLRAGDD